MMDYKSKPEIVIQDFNKKNGRLKIGARSSARAIPGYFSGVYNKNNKNFIWRR